MTHLLDGRNGPDHDLPGAASSQPYIIASVPRSGSTLLARLLWEVGGVGAPKEYLNPMQLRDWEVRFGSPLSRPVHARLRGHLVGAVVGRTWTTRRLQQHLERVRERRSSGGWFGLKLHHHHFERYGGMPFVERVLPGARWIRIQRLDRLGQAISWERALQSGQWAAWQPEGRPVRYRRSALQRRLVAIEQAELGWDAALANHSVLHVTYESLVERPEGVLGEVLAWLGQSPPAMPPRMPTRRQTDDTSSQWRARWASGA
jgi:LPS sulfotransferase NodH